MKNLKFHFLIIAFFVTSSTICFAHEGAKGIVKERMERFKTSKSIMREINKSFSTKDYQKIKSGSIKLKKWSLEMSNYFPEGSNEKPSEANEKIWIESENFELAIQKFTEASIALLKTTEEKDINKVIGAFRNVADTCKGCHKKFRN